MADHGDSPYLQVLEESAILSLSLEELRDQLLSGRLTRHDLCRWVEPEPCLEDFYAVPWLYRQLSGYANGVSTENGAEAWVRAKREVWLKRREWRTIGEGPATEESAIRLLYDPEGVYTDRCTIVAVPLLLVLFGGVALLFALPGGLRGMDSAFSQGKAKDGIAWLFGLFILVLFSAGIGAAVGYCAFAWPLGKLLSAWLDSEPRPPEDGYEPPHRTRQRRKKRNAAARAPSRGSAASDVPDHNPKRGRSRRL